MEWELKIKMTDYFNKGNQLDVIALMANNVRNADTQAWDMFYMDVHLIRDEIYENIGFHTSIYSKAKLLNPDKDFDFKTRIRHTMYINLIEEILIDLNRHLSTEYLLAKGFNIGSNTIFSSLYINIENHNIKLYIEDSEFWCYENNVKKFQVKTISHLCFLIEFVTGKKWTL